jgi:hypothetical protein
MYEHLFAPGRAHSKRASSWDRTGANEDWIRVDAGQTVVLMEHEGPGCITHLYAAMILNDLRDFRNAVLRCYWDGSDQPSVEVPLGDFFAVTHGRVREFSSSMVAVNPGFGSSHGLNAYFPMPFATGARITLTNRGEAAIGGPLGTFWYHVEYETYDEPQPDSYRFHACYRQERPTTAVGDQPNVTLHAAANLDGAENYVALETVGEGRMVGLVLEVENLQGPIWYGEGDDMVFIDGDTWPPSIHGTGSEEIFGGGACPSSEYAGLHAGFHLVESNLYDGLVGSYRWYVPDPIHFSSSLRWTIEHGHANNFSNDYSSVAYWYQSPLATLPPLPEAQDMLPPIPDGYDDARELLLSTVAQTFAQGGTRFFEACQAGGPLMHGHVQTAVQAIEAFRKRL